MGVPARTHRWRRPETYATRADRPLSGTSAEREHASTLFCRRGRCGEPTTSEGRAKRWRQGALRSHTSLPSPCTHQHWRSTSTSCLRHYRVAQLRTSERSATQHVCTVHASSTSYFVQGIHAALWIGALTCTGILIEVWFLRLEVGRTTSDVLFVAPARVVLVVHSSERVFALLQTPREGALWGVVSFNSCVCVGM